jgi:hypothetical protein
LSVTPLTSQDRAMVFTTLSRASHPRDGLSFEEEDRIRRAAQGAGMSVSAFLRQAGLSAARADVVDLERLRRDVNAARARIDDAWQALT